MTSQLRVLQCAIIKGEDDPVSLWLTDVVDIDLDLKHRLFGLAELSIHSSLHEQTIKELLKKILSMLPCDASDEIGVLPPELLTSSRYKRFSARKFAQVLIDAALMPKKIVTLHNDDGSISYHISSEQAQQTKGVVFDAIVEVLSDTIQPRFPIKSLAQSDSAGVIYSLYKYDNVALKEISPKLYEEAFSANNIDVIKALKALNMPTLIDNIGKNPFFFLQNNEIVRKESLALHALLFHPLPHLINQIKNEKEARLLIALRDILPYDMLHHCKSETSKNVILSLM